VSLAQQATFRSITTLTQLGKFPSYVLLFVFNPYIHSLPSQAHRLLAVSVSSEIFVGISV